MIKIFAAEIFSRITLMETKRSQPIAEYQAEFGGFEKLMSKRVKNVLLVASLYDSFLLADDDRLNEALFGELLDASEHAAPKIIRVPTAEKALERLEKSRYDLVIAMIQVGETDMTGFLTGFPPARRWRRGHCRRALWTGTAPRAVPLPAARPSRRPG